MKQIYWEDESKIIHLCDSSEVQKGIRLVWTKCEIDVPANEGFTTTNGKPDVTCNQCIALGADSTQYCKEYKKTPMCNECDQKPDECPICGSSIDDNDNCTDLGGHNCQYVRGML